MLAFRRRHLLEIFVSILFLTVAAVAAHGSEALGGAAAACVIDGNGRLEGLSVTGKAGLLRGPVRVTVSDALTGRSSARRIEVNLYIAHSASVAPPSVREMELYLTGR